MNKLSTAVFVGVAAVVAANFCLYTVNEREHALVFALGELKEVSRSRGFM